VRVDPVLRPRHSRLLWLTAMGVGLLPPLVNARITGGKELTIDFSRTAEARAQAHWSPSLTLSADGIGLDAAEGVTREAWIETVPIPVGMSWRAPAAVRVAAEMTPRAFETADADGGRSITDPGTLYVRYSPDSQHWSTWQVLVRGGGGREADPRHSALILVPRSARKEYEQQLRTYAGLDVPWSSDEDAASRWIVSQDPSFFERNLPFVGYVQLRLERDFASSERLQSLSVEIRYSMGGLHAAPADESASRGRDSQPWSFGRP